MAHFAQLNADNEVTRVVVVANAVLDNDGSESEAQGITHLQNLYGSDTTWKQCSYNHNFRRRFPAIGDTYDATRNAFIKPKPHASFTLDSNGDWQPPVAHPNDGNQYIWNEADQQWDAWSE